MKSHFARTALATALVGAVLSSSCGGTGPTAVAEGALDCPASAPYRGSALHAPLADAVFPSPDDGATDASLPDDLVRRLDARFEQLRVSSGAPALTASLQVAGLGRWAGVQGLARAEPPTPTNPDTFFYWASVSKAFTAVLVLQLVEVGQLRLDDRLERWFPAFPQAARTTIEQLLTHTSGLATTPREGADGPARSIAESVAAAARTPAVFCPGTAASYSNTGCLLLALIVEAVERRQFDEVLQRRIAAPLGLNRLRLFRPGDEAASAQVTPHLGSRPVGEGRVDLRLGAGDVVGAADDIATAWRAVLEG